MENYKLKYPKKNVGEIERSRLICSNEREEAFLYDLYNLIGELGYWKFFEDNAKEIKEWKICHHENLISTYPEYRILCYHQDIIKYTGYSKNGFNIRTFNGMVTMANITIYGGFQNLVNACLEEKK